ncbi:hypothetical protein HK099_005943 [Clydaea vesicula]|uniref:Uncharacterized protein n=1 Tax=Clydaea vesicula TaxID=447962 RepID=A0AAD5TYF1_9FUNG|nr:hypothetical protein HK099_005943 [Clydaea vesicula]
MVQRRMSEEERIINIKSGNVFVWDEAESGIKRWTDGRSWSPSRSSGQFLVYKETEPRQRAVSVISDGHSDSGQTANSSPNANAAAGSEFVVKEDGLIKKTIKVETTLGRRQHLISYFTKSDYDKNAFITPSKTPHLSNSPLNLNIYSQFSEIDIGQNLNFTEPRAENNSITGSNFNNQKKIDFIPNSTHSNNLKQTTVNFSTNSYQPLSASQNSTPITPYTTSTRSIDQLPTKRSLLVVRMLEGQQEASSTDYDENIQNHSSENLETVGWASSQFLTPTNISNKKRKVFDDRNNRDIYKETATRSFNYEAESPLTYTNDSPLHRTDGYFNNKISITNSLLQNKTITPTAKFNRTLNEEFSNFNGLPSMSLSPSSLPSNSPQVSKMNAAKLNSGKGVSEKQGSSPNVGNPSSPYRTPVSAIHRQNLFMEDKGFSNLHPVERSYLPYNERETHPKTSSSLRFGMGSPILDQSSTTSKTEFSNPSSTVSERKSSIDVDSILRKDRVGSLSSVPEMLRRPSEHIDVRRRVSGLSPLILPESFSRKGSEKSVHRLSIVNTAFSTPIESATSAALQPVLEEGFLGIPQSTVKNNQTVINNWNSTKTNPSSFFTTATATNITEGNKTFANVISQQHEISSDLFIEKSASPDDKSVREILSTPALITPPTTLTPSTACSQILTPSNHSPNEVMSNSKKISVVNLIHKGEVNPMKQ